MNDYRGIKIEYHILQSFPVTCLNRDDVGSPKSAIIGGVERGRVSSQCWKRAARLALRDAGLPIAVRTKYIFELISSFCHGEMTDGKKKYIEAVAGVLSDDTLLLISPSEAASIASHIDAISGDYEKAIDVLNKKDESRGRNKDKNNIKTIIAAFKTSGNNSLSSLDIALFGRMIAKAIDLNVEAASSFSHAITTHRISSSVDYFTAVDDLKMMEDEAGVGHIGANEFSSGTYYRYVQLDLGILKENLGEEADISEAVIAFTKALYSAVPRARQTTMAGYCPWNYAHVFVRRGQGMQLSFDTPVRSKGEGFLVPSIEEMEKQLNHNKKLMGSLWGEMNEFIYGIDEANSIDALCNVLRSAVTTVN